MGIRGPGDHGSQHAGRHGARAHGRQVAGSQTAGGGRNRRARRALRRALDHGPRRVWPFGAIDHSRPAAGPQRRISSDVRRVGPACRRPAGRRAAWQSSDRRWLAAAGKRRRGPARRVAVATCSLPRAFRRSLLPAGRIDQRRRRSGEAGRAGRRLAARESPSGRGRRRALSRPQPFGAGRRSDRGSPGGQRQRGRRPAVSQCRTRDEIARGNGAALCRGPRRLAAHFGNRPQGHVFAR